MVQDLIPFCQVQLKCAISRLVISFNGASNITGCVRKSFLKKIINRVKLNNNNTLIHLAARSFEVIFYGIHRYSVPKMTKKMNVVNHYDKRGVSNMSLRLLESKAPGEHIG